MDQMSAAQQLVGAVFNGRWRLARLIGEGGMGAVYEAHGTRNEGTRAIKVLHPEFIAEDQILSRFMAEAQAVRQLQHPNIAQIYDQGRAEDGTPYLIMELLQGAPLSSFMHPGRPLASAQAAGILLGVLQALTVAHSRGVVHRDLKPDNLFLVPDGRGNHVVKVLDFGIAKVMDVAGGMGSKTKTGVLLGTPGYMSPEQIKNSKAVDPRSDLWSCAVIFYEMMTGREAFPAENEFTRLTLVLTQEIKPIGEVAPQLSAWGSFFKRALSKDAAGRFQSAQEMAQAVAAMMSGSQSAQGRDGGTVALNVPSQPNPHTQNSPAAQRHPAPMSTAVAQQSAAPYSAQQHSAASFAQPASLHAQYSMGPAMNATPHQGRASAPPPQSYVSAGSIPPPSALPAPVPNQNPATQFSQQRPPGVPTMAAGMRSPAVEVLTPPPVGVPWWVVGAVGGACFILGFIAGFVAS
ncbi:MAG: protein kinase [Polyangiaceae bacterium]|nr:protein kinase [Polyangiaceae bacterium]